MSAGAAPIDHPIVRDQTATLARAIKLTAYATVSVLLLVRLLEYGHLAATLLQFPYQVMEGEGIVLSTGMSILHNASPYRDPAAPPWVIAPYPPLFPVLSAAVTRLVGVSLTAGRLVSLGGTFLSLGLMVWLILSQTERVHPRHDWRAHFLIAGLLVTAYAMSPFVYEWSPLGRVDMLGTALSLAGIALAIRYGHSYSHRWLFLSGSLCVLGLWTKQTAVAAPIAITVWLLLKHEGRRAATFSLGVASAVVAGYFGLDYWSGGGFTATAIQANVLPWWPRVLADYGRRLLVLYPWFLACGLAYGLLWTKTRKPDLLLFYMSAAWGVALSAGHTGAAPNYFIIPLAATTVCAGQIIGRVLNVGRPFLATWVVVGLALQVTWFSFADTSAIASWFRRSPEWGYGPSGEDTLKVRSIEKIAQERGGLLLSEDPLINLRIDQPVVAVPSSSISALDRYGDWASGKESLVRAISARCFRTIVLTRADYPPEVLEAIHRGYRQMTSIADEGPGIARMSQLNELRST